VSYGDFRIKGLVTPPYKITKPACDPGLGRFRDSIAGQARQAARTHGYDLSKYETIVYDFPANPCLDNGQATVGGQDVWLPDFLGHLGQPFDMYQATMEITHTLGLAHANGLECERVTLCEAPTGANSSNCNPNPPPYNCEYGNPWDAMGSDLAGWNYSRIGAVPGDGSLDGIELADLGWSAGRTDAVNATADGVYTLSPIELARPTHPQVLLVHAVSGDFSVEYRRPIGVDRYLACWPLATHGVQVNVRDNLPNSHDGPKQPLLLDMTPDSDASADRSGPCLQPPKGETSSHVCSQGIAHSATFCDWFDSTLGVGETWDGPFTLTVLSATATGVKVEVGNASDSVVIHPTLHDFGAVAPGSTSASAGFTLQNLTQQSLHVSSVDLGQGSASPFTITHDGCSAHAISPGGTCTVDGEAQPPPNTPWGTTLRDTLTFHDDWPPLPDQTVRLSVFVTDASPSGAWFTEVGSSNGSVGLHDLACDPTGKTNRCWAVGNGGNPNTAGSGRVVFNRGGDHWVSQKIPSHIGLLNFISCVSGTRCWAVGETHPDQTGPPVLIKTADAGRTWVRLALPRGAGVGAGDATARIDCVTANGVHCWIPDQDRIVATTNGGSTWFVEHLPNAPGSNEVNDISFSDARHGQAAGGVIPVFGSSYNVIWGTSDGGRTWRVERTRSPSRGIVANYVSCVSAKQCWAAGFHEPNPSTRVVAVLGTDDGGHTWNRERVPITGFSLPGGERGLSCARTRPVRCWVVGYTRTGGFILRTVTGGARWTRQRPPSEVVSVDDVTAIGPLRGWAIPEMDSGLPDILVTDTGGMPPP
jgi:photosystem II stability/assembly factor-like uncharacterized protein